MVAVAHAEAHGPTTLRAVPAPAAPDVTGVPEVVHRLLRDERAVTAAADAVALVAAIATAGHRVGWGTIVVLAAGLALGRRRTVGIRAAVLPGLPKLWVALAVATLVASHVGDGLLVAAGFALALGAVASVARGVAGGLLAVLHRRGIGVRRTLIVGSGKLADTLAWKLTRHRELGLQVVGTLAPCGRRGLGWGLGVGALAADLPDSCAGPRSGSCS